MAIGSDRQALDDRDGDMEGQLERSEWFQTRRRKARVVVGAFIAVAISSVALSMFGDSWERDASSPYVALGQTSVEVGTRGRPQITALTAKAAMHLKAHIHSLAENATAEDSGENNSTAGDAAPAAADAAAPAAADTAPAEDENEAKSEEDKNEGDGEKTKSEPAENDEPEVKNRPAFDSHHDMMRPGWGEKTGWDASDWAVWIICGPILTLAACMFVFYTFGWTWALGVFAALVVVDVFAYYYNV